MSASDHQPMPRDFQPDEVLLVARHKGNEIAAVVYAEGGVLKNPDLQRKFDLLRYSCHHAHQINGAVRDTRQLSIGDEIP